MKYYPRLNQYKASNVIVNPDTLKSWSYGWWCFSKLIEGRLVFNFGHYSNTTGRHQQKAHSVLCELDHTPELYVFTRQCLDRGSLSTIAMDTAEYYATEFVARLHSRDPHSPLSWRADAALKAVRVLEPIIHTQIISQAVTWAETARRERLDAAKARRAAKRLQENTPRLRLVGV